MADGDRLLQVLTNLMGNAVRHGGADVRLTVRARRDGGDVAIEVTNTGTSIPPDELPRLFDRFYRSDATRAGVSPGSGLGLAIVRSLTEQMGGTVAVRSEDGATTFEVRLVPADTTVIGPDQVPGSGPNPPAGTCSRSR
jgi:signal transduction histidine kinase